MEPSCLWRRHVRLRWHPLATVCPAQRRRQRRTNHDVLSWRWGRTAAKLCSKRACEWIRSRTSTAGVGQEHVQVVQFLTAVVATEHDHALRQRQRHGTRGVARSRRRYIARGHYRRPLPRCGIDVLAVPRRCRQSQARNPKPRTLRLTEVPILQSDPCGRCHAHYTQPQPLIRHTKS